MGEEIIQLSGPLADQMSKHLAFLLAREIRARGGGGQIKLRRIARMLGHGGLSREH